MEPAQKLLFHGGSTRGSIGPTLNTEPALSPRTSPSKTETSTWWERTSTRAYSRLPRKPYQEEQGETTDHSGVKNYKTSRKHWQKPEQQPKSILHRRTTPNSNKPKPNFSGTRYRHTAQAGEKKKKKPTRFFRKMAKSFGNLQSSSMTKVTPEQRSP